MGIINRIIRVCKADLHGLMDQIEDKGLLLKQYLRDMEEAIVQKEERLKLLILLRDKTQHDYERYDEERKRVDQDLNMAIKKEKDEIAKMLIKRLRSIAQHLDALGRHIEESNKEIDTVQNAVADERIQLEQLQLKARTYFQRDEKKEWDRVVPDSIYNNDFNELSKAEIELELIKRKEAVQNIKGGIEK